MTPGNAAIEAWPNPATDQLTLEVRMAKPEAVELQLFDLSGKLKMKRTLSSTGLIREQLDLSDLPAGAYFLVVSGERTSGVRKVLKR